MGYMGNQNKIVNSEYLYNTIQGLKTTYIDTIHNYANQTVLDGISAEKVASWDSAATLSLDFESTALDLTSLT